MRLASASDIHTQSRLAIEVTALALLQPDGTGANMKKLTAALLSVAVAGALGSEASAAPRVRRVAAAVKAASPTTGETSILPAPAPRAS